MCTYLVFDYWMLHLSTMLYHFLAWPLEGKVKCGRNESFPNQVLSSSELAARGAGLILKVLLNPTSGRDASHPCLGVPYPSLGQVLIRQGWEASLPDVGLSKTLRIRPAPRAANSKEDNT